MVSKLLVFVPFISISRRLKSKSSIYVHDISTYIEKNNFNGTCGIQCIIPYINPYILLILLISSNVCFFFTSSFFLLFFFTFFCPPLLPSGERQDLQLLLERSLQPPLNRIQILIRSNIVLPASLAARQGQILGHDAVHVDGVNAGLLEALGKGHQLGGVVELAALDEAAGPGEDGGDGVGGGLAALLVLTVVAGDGAVGGFGLKGLAVRGDEDRGHEAEGAKALGDNVGLDVTVVVYEEMVSYLFVIWL